MDRKEALDILNKVKTELEIPFEMDDILDIYPKALDIRLALDVAINNLKQLIEMESVHVIELEEGEVK